MKKYIYIAYKILFCVIWCAFWGAFGGIRVYYPKNYPSMDKYFLPWFIIILLIAFLGKIIGVRYDWKNNIMDLMLLMLNSVIFFIPILKLLNG